MRGHDDSGQDIVSGYLPFEIDGASKFDSAEGSCVLGMNEQDARKIRDLIALGSSAVAEFATEVFSCAYEACSAWYVSVPSHENGTLATGQKFVAEYDVANDLSDFGPMLSKQTRYTFDQIQRTTDGARGQLLEPRYFFF